MVVPGWSRSVHAARAAAGKVSGFLRHQLITRNRRVGVALAVVTVVISVGAVQISEQWFSPGVLILPVLAGGLLLWPRALYILFGFIAAGLAYDALMGLAGPGLIATIVVTALLAAALARTRKRLGMQGLRGSQMLIDLRDQPGTTMMAALYRPSGGIRKRPAWPGGSRPPLVAGRPRR